MNKKTHTNRSQSGFTLMELLIVIVIIGMLVALVAPRFTSRISEAGVKTTKAQVELLASALETYNMDIGDFPNTDQGLSALLEKPNEVANDRWRGPYLKKLNLPRDAWKNDFIYQGPDDQEVMAKRLDYIISSLGKDGKPGGSEEDADIKSYE